MAQGVPVAGIDRPAATLRSLQAEADGYDHATIQAGPQRLHVVVAGEGPLVLLLHGFAGSWRCWSHQISALAEAGYMVAAPDQRGYGRSSKPNDVEAYSILNLVDDCVAIVEALGKQYCVVIGHDWGAPVAWTSAWTKPDVFRGVAGLSLAFGGRGLIPISGIDSFGAKRPSVVQREIAGPDKLFYQEFWSQPGVLQKEFDLDSRSLLIGEYYGYSADAFPVDYEASDPLAADPEVVAEETRSGGSCIEPGASYLDAIELPDELPAWLAEDINFYVEEFERTGLEAALNWYRAMDLSWEQLEPWEGTPIEVPAIFIGGDLDITTMWCGEAVAAFPTTVPQHRTSVVVERCGHMITREKPHETSQALLTFLASFLP